MLLCKRFFDTKMSQAKVADNFMVHPKKLHLVVSRRKYDPGKKMTKCKTSETPMTTPNKAKKNPKDQPQDELKVDTRKTNKQCQPKMTQWMLTVMRNYWTHLENNNLMMRESSTMTYLHSWEMMNQKFSA